MEINSTEPDPELRADKLADAVLLQQSNTRLCYEQSSTLQVLRPGLQSCVEQQLLQHYPHAPYAGSM